MSQVDHNSDHNPQGGRYAPVDDSGDHGGVSRVKASPAKIQGNRVHQRLKMLALAWVKKQHPRVEERLRREARRIEDRRGQ